MDEEQIKKIERELLGQIDQEVNEEKQVATQAKDVATQLKSRGTAAAQIDQRNFVITFMAKGNNITLIVADKAKYDLMGEKYRPYIVEGQIDNEFSMHQNLEAVCESFIRHILGAVRPESLQEGDVITNE